MTISYFSPVAQSQPVKFEVVSGSMYQLGSLAEESSIVADPSDITWDVELLIDDTEIGIAVAFRRLLLAGDCTELVFDCIKFVVDRANSVVDCTEWAFDCIKSDVDCTDLVVNCIVLVVDCSVVVEEKA